jgi:hypothetical protein
MWNRMHGWLIAIALRVNHGVGGWQLAGLPFGGWLFAVSS